MVYPMAVVAVPYVNSVDAFAGKSDARGQVLNARVLYRSLQYFITIGEQNHHQLVGYK